MNALVPLAITLVIEVPAVALVYPRERARMALACAIATSFTNVLMNTVLYRAVHSYTAYVLIGEIGAAVFEALVYWRASREHEIGRALLASAIANGLSFGAGLALF